MPKKLLLCAIIKVGDNMKYEKISLNKDGELKDYDLITEITLEKYHSNYIVFTEDANKEEMDIYVMKVLDDGTLLNVTGTEYEDCKNKALEGIL